MDLLAENGRPILSLLIVFSLLGLTIWKLGRRRGDISLVKFLRKPRSNRTLESLERLALTPQHTLHVLRLDGREMVVATHPHGCTVLHRVRTGVSRGAGA